MLVFALAAISLVATAWIGIYLIGGAIVLLYVAVGAWLISSQRVVIVDAQERQMKVLSRYFLVERQTKVTPFEVIASVYLDFETHAYYSFFRPQTLVRRMWRIFFCAQR